MTYGDSLHHLRLQPPPPTVAGALLNVTVESVQAPVVKTTLLAAPGLPPAPPPAPPAVPPPGDLLDIAKAIAEDLLDNAGVRLAYDPNLTLILSRTPTLTLTLTLALTLTLTLTLTLSLSLSLTLTRSPRTRPSSRRPWPPDRAPWRRRPGLSTATAWRSGTGRLCLRECCVTVSLPRCV